MLTTTTTPVIPISLSSELSVSLNNVPENIERDRGENHGEEGPDPETRGLGQVVDSRKEGHGEYCLVFRIKMLAGIF